MNSDGVRQNLILTSGRFEEEKNFWLDTLQGEAVMSRFPARCQHSGKEKDGRNTASFFFPKHLFDRIVQVSNGSLYTANVLMLCVVTCLLHKYTGSDDIIVGMPIFRKGAEETYENSVVAIRANLDEKATFKQFLVQVRSIVSEVSHNQNVPIAKIAEMLGLWSEKSIQPLFGVIVAMDGIHNQMDWATANADMVFSFSMGQTCLKLELEYNTSLYEDETLGRMARHLFNMMEQAVFNPDIRLYELEAITEDEKQRILYEFNDTKAPYPDDKTLHSIFEEQVEKIPEQPAVLFGDKTFTYRELNERANSLAKLLRAEGIGPDKIVAIAVRRSLEMAVGILGILKAGGAYLPIDPSFPQDRISYMLEDSGASVLLVQGGEWNIENENQVKFIKIIDLNDEGNYRDNGTNLEHINTPRDLAYVIYTSGSTGKPKGTMIEHRSAINRIYWMQKMYPIGPEDTILQKTPYTFDVSVWELFWWFFNGSKLCFLSPGGEKYPETIIEAIHQYGITTLHFVPSMLSIFLEYMDGRNDMEKLSGLRQVFASGEALGIQQVRRFNGVLHDSLGVKLHNLYGPTETAVDVSYFDCSTGKELEVIPIGKPIDNIRLYILDKYNRLQPVGVPGELCISGDGVGRGYLNRPELTAEKFVDDPFFEGERIYRTGDLARWMADGNIEYLGRMDFQVKIRGFRIELGEIEKLILEYQGTKECVVVAKGEEQQERYLVAYYTADREYQLSELRGWLSKSLPDYMIPSAFVYMEKLPLSSNGKVDRKVLPEPNISAINRKVEYVAPGTDTEMALVDIWRSILKLEAVGIHDNFFDLGGNSLKLVSMHGQLDKLYPGITKVTDIFAYPTISKLAHYIEQGGQWQGFDKIELKGIGLPSEFYTTGEDENEDTLLKLQVGGVREGLERISQVGSVKILDTFMAVFAYLMHRISKCRELTLYTPHDDGLSILPVDADLNNIDDFLSLQAQFGAKHAEIEQGGGYPAAALSGIMQAPNIDSVIPLICMDTVGASVPKGVFDIVLILSMDESLSICCEYNAMKLRKEKVEALVYDYCNMLKAIAASFSEE